MSEEEGTGKPQSGGEGRDFYKKRNENITPKGLGTIGYTDAIRPLTEQQAPVEGVGVRNEGPLWGSLRYSGTINFENLLEIENSLKKFEETHQETPEEVREGFEEIQTWFKGFIEEPGLRERFEEYKNEIRPKIVESTEPKTDSTTSTAPQDNPAA